MSKTYPKPAKQELRNRMDDGLAQFLTFIDQFSEEQMLNPTDAAGWNVRDHITHLAAWAEGIAALLRRENRWAAMGLALDSSSRDNMDETALILSYERFVAPFSRDGGRPIWGLIAGNTFGHYKQHTPWIEAIVESMSAS